ncbi:uncharacterized protein LOC143183182 isoform X2 [Calliopsis andreniformis]|uniref:uncharacterized protein LOC143183182 isoform X2 n=1 Tax=Calliopsis andreniformis TaxID=337506 RepID=UPI003FCC3A34
MLAHKSHQVFNYSSNTGLLFYPLNVDHEEIFTPPNFLKRYIKSSFKYLTTYISNLRICICKTENSVPALGRIEVWGTVSPRCGKDTVASICTLWSKHHDFISETSEKSESNHSFITVKNNREKELKSNLDIPESFLDAITWEIMTQPILLPSGKIIDQSTLQKHEETEALWGRSLTDPFTGMPFSVDRKPVIASALKVRIDKFLLENSNAEEIKKLPRVLGHAASSSTENKKISELPKYVLKNNWINESLSDVKTKLHCSTTNAQENKKFCHKLPVAVMCHKRSTQALIKSVKRKKTNFHIQPQKESESEVKNDNFTDVNLSVDSSETFDNNTVIPNLKRFDSIPKQNDMSEILNSCSCCSDGIFYQLPCKHVLCRKVLTSIQNNQCTLCNISYKNNEIERIHQ